MCARRFLLVILVLTLIAVAGAFAIYQWGGDVLIKEAQPQGHFQAAAAGSGPNYAEASNWVARPDLTDDPSRWLPGGAEQPDKIGGAAIFYIHPTTYLERDRWNAPLFPGGDSEFRTRLFVQSQASAYSGAGQVWAPRYRQAAFGAFLLDSEDARRALELAYADVDAAFAEFLKSVPKSTPIILAGHSQGALHLEHLLREHGAALKGRIVAAYVAGWPISTTADLPALALPACESPDQAGCILSWMSFGDPPQPDLVLNSYEHSPGFSGAKRKRDDLLCVNPLTGTAGGAAPPEANPGTLVPSTDLRSGTLVAGAVGAHCDKGLLVLDGVIPPLGPFVLPGNNYHVYDYALFWAAIRRDAERRLAAWQKR